VVVAVAAGLPWVLYTGIGLRLVNARLIAPEVAAQGLFIGMKTSRWDPSADDGVERSFAAVGVREGRRVDRHSYAHWR
jgi:hypothetical protein